MPVVALRLQALAWPIFLAPLAVASRFFAAPSGAGLPSRRSMRLSCWCVLLQRPVLEKILRGEITLVFRRWLRPSVKAGGTLKTALGVLAIDALERIEEHDISESDAQRAGSSDRATLLAQLRRGEGDLYKIALHHAGADPRIQLRAQSDLGEAEIVELRRRLDRFDASSRSGPWTRAALRAIARRPAVLAAKLAQELGQPTVEFKRNIRKLKELGLTESLDIGYRVSPRGSRLLEHLD